MTADICDEDELVTGLRREGAFIAVGGFFGKVAQVATLLLAGALPRMAGIRRHKRAADIKRTKGNASHTHQRPIRSNPRRDNYHLVLPPHALKI